MVRGAVNLRRTISLPARTLVAPALPVNTIRLEAQGVRSGHSFGSCMMGAYIRTSKIIYVMRCPGVYRNMHMQPGWDRSARMRSVAGGQLGPWGPRNRASTRVGEVTLFAP